MERCPKDEPTAKNLVCKEALPIPEKNGKNLLGLGWHPLPLGHWRVNNRFPNIWFFIEFD